MLNGIEVSCILSSMDRTELKERLAALGWSQRELGRQLGKTPETINSWACGRSSVPDYAEAYLNAVEIEPAEGWQRPTQMSYTLNGKPINASDFMRHATWDIAGNYSERIVLKREHLERATPGLRDWARASISGAEFLSLERLVRAAHLCDANDPNPEMWHFIHRGGMPAVTATTDDRISSCPVRAVVEQTKSAYLDVLLSGEPSIELCRRDAAGKQLDFVRVIVPTRDGKLRVGIDYEDPPVQPQHPTVLRHA